MKFKYIFGIILLFLTFTLSAKAESGQKYIVYLKQSAESDCEKPYTVMSEAELSEYLKSDMVDFYEPDYEVPLLEDFSFRSASAWNLSAINVQKAWDIGCYGNYVTVAVIDSGVYAHPDLANNLLAGHNYIDDNSDTNDDIGHGTYVSGIIAAEANGEYIDGVANRAKIVPLKCFASGRPATTSVLTDAIYDAVNTYHADVINMSFGMPYSLTTTTFQLAIQYAVDNGCIVVAAVGNSGNTTINNIIYYPAGYPDVIGVGSVDSNLSKSSFSSYNSSVCVVAPGGGVSSVAIEGFTNNSGTSFACPHVSAMAAIAKCIDKDISANEFREILEETSTDLGDTGYDTYYGYGLINIEAMIDKMLENTPLFISPVSETADGTEVTVYNNSQNPFVAEGFAAGYENGMLSGITLSDISLSAKETAKMNCLMADSVKFMLWRNFEPLKKAAEYAE